VFIIVSPVAEKSDKGKNQYRITTVRRHGVPAFGPEFPERQIFEEGPYLRKFLLTKLINAERATVNFHPTFVDKMHRTREQILKNLITECTVNAKKGKVVAVKPPKERVGAKAFVQQPAPGN